jgi:hypothetical protein
VARLFTDGFEIASNTNGHSWTNVVDLAARDTGTVRTGTGSGLINGLTSGTESGWGVQFVDSLQNGPFYLRTYFYLTTAPSADNTIAAFIAGANPTATSTNDAQIRLTSAGALKLFANNSQVGSTSSALSTGTWYRIELEVDNSPSAGSKIIRAYIDGTQFAGTTASSDVGGTINGLALGGNLNVEAQTTGVWRFDDVAVNDSSGSFQTGLPGPGNVIVIRPNAAGDSNQFNNTANGAGSSNNYQLVDETSPNDATDMVQSGTLNNLDLYNFEATGLTAATVSVVHVHLRRRNNTADATTAVTPIVVKTSGGTQASGVAVSPNTTTWRTGGNAASTVVVPNYTGYQDPDGSAWTPSTLDTMQAGPKITTANVNRIQVSTVWATIDYVPAVTGAAAGSLSITGAATGLRTVLGSAAGSLGITGAANGTRSTFGTAAGSLALSGAAAGVRSSAIGTLTDNFDDNSIDTSIWEANYGSVAETGGRARVDCDVSQWSAYKSGSRYFLTGSAVSARLYPPSGGAGDGAYSSLIVTSSTAGTDAGFLVDAGAGVLGVYNRVGFSDAGALFPTYSATDHAYLRLREDAGTIFWESSPDASTWTELRSETSPSWVDDLDLALVLESHRSSGTDNFAEYDDVNVSPAGSTVTGSAAGSLSISGTATGVRTVLGSAAGSLGLSGTAVGTRTVLGTAAGSLAVSGAATGLRTVLGAAAGSLSLAGAATGLRSVLGTAAGSLGLSGAASGTRTTFGSATGSLALVGAATGQVPDAIIERPDTGTVGRPSSGTVTRPFTGIIERP